ncbi:hypothetical protein ACP4OV_004677 [Aristida adscensionis]
MAASARTRSAAATVASVVLSRRPVVAGARRPLPLRQQPVPAELPDHLVGEFDILPFCERVDEGRGQVGGKEHVVHDPLADPLRSRMGVLHRRPVGGPSHGREQGRRRELAGKEAIGRGRVRI